MGRVTAFNHLWTLTRNALQLLDDLLRLGLTDSCQPIIGILWRDEIFHINRSSAIQGAVICSNVGDAALLRSCSASVVSSSPLCGAIAPLPTFFDPRNLSSTPDTHSPTSAPTAGLPDTTTTYSTTPPPPASQRGSRSTRSARCLFAQRIDHFHAAGIARHQHRDRRLFLDGNLANESTYSLIDLTTASISSSGVYC